jgi:transposase-like protein
LKNRDKKSAKKFFQKALRARHNQQPRIITIDKYAATEMAIFEQYYRARPSFYKEWETPVRFAFMSK